MSPPPGPVWTVDLLLPSSRSDAVAEAERIERSVFADAFDCDDHLWEAEFPPYDDRTVWITVNHRGRMVGTLRAVVGPSAGLKFAADLERFWGVSLPEALARHGVAPDLQLIEAATMTVLPDDRRRDGWWAVKVLAGAFWHLVIDSGARYAVQLLDPRVLRVLTMVTGARFERLADLEPADFQGLMIPTFSPVAHYLDTIAPTDLEYRRLVVERDESGRGGTRLPTIDLASGSPLARHGRLLAAHRSATSSPQHAPSPTKELSS